MGMAASQARFLGLTARKTNTEFEGQQINQQRTTLGNQSANYYNQLLGMTVPVPPSIADFTKTVYTFSDGALNNSITTMTAQQGGTYLISYTSTWTNDFAVVQSNPAIYTRSDANEDGNYTYFVGAKQLRKLGEIPTDAEGKYIGEASEDPNKKYFDEYLSTLSAKQIEQLKGEEDKYLKQLNDKYGEGEWLVRYVKNTSTDTWSPSFVKKEVLEAETTQYNERGMSQSNIPTYTVGSAKETEEIKGVQARLEQDASGRIISITINPDSDDRVTYPVKTNTVTDQAKYDDATNQYEYDKHKYDQSIQEINAKIEIVQAEDRNLELRLKQLDTEQDAIQTEMDAVQKVIEKNTESTFKTFG